MEGVCAEDVLGRSIRCHIICDVIVYVAFLQEVSGLGGEAGWYAALYLLIVGGGLVFILVCLGVCLDIIR